MNYFLLGAALLAAVVLVSAAICLIERDGGEQ